MNTTTLSDGWDLHARMATDSLRERVADIRPLCHTIVEQDGITPHQLMALDHAVLACRWIIVDFDAQHPDRDLPMPRCVGGLIDFWLSVNERLRPAAPGPEGSDRDEAMHAEAYEHWKADQ